MTIISKQHQRFMRLAIAKANAGILRGQTPFGACIVKDGRVVSCEHNVVWKTCDITAHAEIQAIRVACRKLKTVDLSGCVIYSTCEPCPMCFSACHWARISKVVYGTSIADAKRAGFNELAISNTKMKKQGKSPIKLVRGCLLKENGKLFKCWNDRSQKKVY